MKIEVLFETYIVHTQARLFANPYLVQWISRKNVISLIIIARDIEASVLPINCQATSPSVMSKTCHRALFKIIISLRLCSKMASLAYSQFSRSSTMLTPSSPRSFSIQTSSKNSFNPSGPVEPKFSVLTAI